MRLLVLGGTAWLGRVVAETAREDGHDVTCLARGESGSAASEVTFVRADRSSAAGYRGLHGEFDRVVDVARHPGQVRSAVAALSDRCGTYVFVSTGDGTRTTRSSVRRRRRRSWTRRFAHPSNPFNLLGDSQPLSEHLGLVRQVVGHHGPVVTASTPWLLEQGVGEWMGPRSLPLWENTFAWQGFSARNNAGAKAVGLTLRPAEDTVRDALVWAETDARAWNAGLSDADERDLLARL